MRRVAFCFDFVSPYAWLALAQARRFGVENGVEWDLQPVVYAKLLETFGLLGPAEIDVKRRYTYRDVARCARRLGLAFEGPPAHPFRSLEALRVATLFRSSPQALELSVGLADAAWARGRDLTDPEVLADVVRGAGLDATALGERIADARVKQELRHQTDQAIDAGVFGVPSFVLDDEIFWGHDRLSYLAERLAGSPPPSREQMERKLARPVGVLRKRS